MNPARLTQRRCRREVDHSEGPVRASELGLFPGSGPELAGADGAFASLDHRRARAKRCELFDAIARPFRCCVSGPAAVRGGTPSTGAVLFGGSPLLPRNAASGISLGMPMVKEKRSLEQAGKARGEAGGVVGKIVFSASGPRCSSVMRWNRRSFLVSIDW